MKCNFNPVLSPEYCQDGYDRPPDYCHGGAGMIALQAALMQYEGEKIILFPAWPEEWDLYFKLHAPHETTVHGIYRDVSCHILITNNCIE